MARRATAASRRRWLTVRDGAAFCRSISTWAMPDLLRIASISCAGVLIGLVRCPWASDATRTVWLLIVWGNATRVVFSSRGTTVMSVALSVDWHSGSAATAGQISATTAEDCNGTKRWSEQVRANSCSMDLPSSTISTKSEGTKVLWSLSFTGLGSRKAIEYPRPTGNSWQYCLPFARPKQENSNANRSTSSTSRTSIGNVDLSKCCWTFENTIDLEEHVECLVMAIVQHLGHGLAVDHNGGLLHFAGEIDRVRCARSFRIGLTMAIWDDEKKNYTAKCEHVVTERRIRYRVNSNERSDG